MELPAKLATGRCSKVTFEVLDPVQISGITQSNGHPDPNNSSTGIYLVKNPAGSTFPATVNEFDGGQVAVEVGGTISAVSSKFVGVVQSYFDSSENKNVFFIEIRKVDAATLDISSLAVESFWRDSVISKRWTRKGIFLFS